MNEEFEALKAFDRITLHTEYDNDSCYDSLKFEDDCNLVYEALYKLPVLEFIYYLFKKKILPASKKYIDEEAPFFKLTFAFEKDSEAYKFLKSLLFLKELEK